MSGRRIRILGLTGGIGAGKSTVSARLSALGAYVLDADAISRKLLEPNGGCFLPVVDAFGHDILRADGSINRGALAAIVFTDANAREKLESIVHPAVKVEMCARAQQILHDAPNALIVFDVPLLIESGMQTLTDAVLLVTAPEETRIARIAARDALDASAAKQRIAAQMPDAEKLRYADFVLDNSGTLDALYTKLDALYASLMERQV